MLTFSEPETPFTVTVVEVAAALESTVNLKVSEAFARRFNVLGETVTPEGIPVSEMVTTSVKPFWPATLTCAVFDEPSGIESASVEREIVKPGTAGVIGGGVDGEDAPPPPQAEIKRVEAIRMINRTRLGIAAPVMK